ncbi:uncharacterized protein PV09_06579 [Verruconis gallopava]|uniref:Uncharacterized protein n=1 Tax=Verruconis gallopava TaxID=253628 RepID=A0A0D1YMW4_9PEZI|nr:uncharacterized protein PV09_06579 [Verruconis gallopava]KIW02087.1 hypothetical protein PV09_06579 [Verruconis gallopava]
MGIFSKLKNDVPDDTIGRILTRNPNVVKIEQVKERNVKFMPWLSSKKTTVFYFQPEVQQEQQSEPSEHSSTRAALPAPAVTETALVNADKKPATTTQASSLSIKDEKGRGQEYVSWNAMQLAGTLMAAATVAAAGGKQAYDLYRRYSEKKE